MNEPTRALKIIAQNLGAEVHITTLGDLMLSDVNRENFLGPMLCVETAQALNEVAKYMHWVKNENLKHPIDR